MNFSKYAVYLSAIAANINPQMVSYSTICREKKIFMHCDITYNSKYTRTISRLQNKSNTNRDNSQRTIISTQLIDSYLIFSLDNSEHTHISLDNMSIFCFNSIYNALTCLNDPQHFSAINRVINNFDI